MKSEDIGSVEMAFAAKAPRVRAAPPGPRDSAPVGRFKERYAKSEVFWDKGRRHYDGNVSNIFETSPSRGTSKPAGGHSPGPSGAPSPCKAQRIQGTSPRATIGVSQGAAARAIACGAVSASVSVPVAGKSSGGSVGVPVAGKSSGHSRDLFSGGAFAPMRRSASQGRSACQSPSSAAGNASAPSELVREASRRLFAAFPTDKPSYRDNESMASSPMGKSWSYAPPMAIREVPTPQSSASMANLLQDESPCGRRATPNRKGVTLTREGWTSRRTATTRNASPRMKSLLSNDNETGERPVEKCRQRSDLCTSPKRQQSPRGSSTPAPPAVTPWATHYPGDGEDESLKLAEVARTCLKTQDLEKRNGEKMQLRVKAKVIQPTTPRGQARVIHNHAPMDARTLHVSGAGGVAASARVEIHAPVPGANHQVPIGSYPLQESWTKVQAANQMPANPKMGWQEPAKTRVPVNHCYEILYAHPAAA
mmetsp:Transcript_32753/g.58043  ORF Transcript_32753/g.58043 Transcript_32753/m.58043 type:complete len:479 (-) Transcript_32753:222-1658(-)